MDGKQEKQDLPSKEQLLKNAEKFNDYMELSMIGCVPMNSMEKHPTYRVQVFVSHGYFEYSVDRMEQAMAHAQAIMATGVYRRAVDEETVEFHTAYKVKVRSNLRDLGSAYGDKFVRT